MFTINNGGCCPPAEPVLSACLQVGPEGELCVMINGEEVCCIKKYGSIGKLAIARRGYGLSSFLRAWFHTGLYRQDGRVMTFSECKNRGIY